MAHTPMAPGLERAQAFRWLLRETLSFGFQGIVVAASVNHFTFSAPGERAMRNKKASMLRVALFTTALLGSQHPAYGMSASAAAESGLTAPFKSTEYAR